MSKLKQFIYKDNNYKIYYLAEKECDDLDNVSNQIWHREDGPTDIEYYEDGRIRYEGYWINDKEHREDGPARIWYDEDGSISDKEFFLNGVYYKKEKYDLQLKKLKSKIGKELYE